MLAQQLDFPHRFEHLDDNLRTAVEALHRGQAVLLLDANDRENEGDLIIAAEKITSSSMNFLIKEGSGVVCLAMPKDRLEALGLPLMSFNNTNTFQTAFTVSIEAVQGVSTGVSAHDRAHTIQTAIADNAKAEDLARPGHVFPLAAKMGGVFERMGHTEGSVDLMKIAGLKLGAVLCELMNEDGSMTVGDDRIRFAQKHGIPMLSVEDVLFHRIRFEIALPDSKKLIETKKGPLLWQQLSILDTTIDIFTQPHLDAAKSIDVSIVDGKNLHNRYLAQILNNTKDDALVAALDALKSDNQVVAMISGGEERRNLALLCRALCEKGIKTINNNLLAKSFIAIAKDHFSFKIF